MSENWKYKRDEVFLLFCAFFLILGLVAVWLDPIYNFHNLGIEQVKLALASIVLMVAGYSIKDEPPTWGASFIIVIIAAGMALGLRLPIEDGSWGSWVKILTQLEAYLAFSALGRAKFFKQP